MKYLMSLTFVAAIHLLTAMSGYSETKLDFGLRECVKLEAGERQIEISNDILLLYEDACYMDSAVTYMNRAFHSRHGKVLISMCTEMIEPDLIHAFENDASFNFLSYEKTSYKGNLFHRYLVEKNGHYIYRVVYSDVKYNLVYLYNVISDSENRMRELYANEEYFNEKFNCKP